MIITIAKKEFTELIRDGRFRWAGIVVLLLLVAALGLGWKNYQTVSAEREAAQRESRDSWINQGERNPHSAAHFGVYAFRPRQPLSLVDPGLDNYAGNTIWIEAHYQNPARNRPIEDATALQRFGELTAAGVLLLLVPLLIIFLTFDSFAGERERGTLRQLASVGVKPFDLSIGKILGIFAALLTLVVPAALLGSAALVLATSFQSFGAIVPSIALMSIAFVLYFVFFAGISLTVSALASSTRVAMTVLLAFWVAACILIPRVASDVADTLYTVPAPKDFWEKVDAANRDGIDGHDPRNERTKELEELVLAQYGVTKKEDLPVNFGGISMQASEEHANTVYDKYYGELTDIHLAQERVHHFFGFLSPMMSMKAISMGFAGTDLKHQQHFSHEVEQYRRVLNKMLNDDLAYSSTQKDASTYRVGKEFWEKTPDLEYLPPQTSAVLGYLTPNILLLLGWGLVSLILAVVAARRIKVI